MTTDRVTTVLHNIEATLCASPHPPRERNILADVRADVRAELALLRRHEEQRKERRKKWIGYILFFATLGGGWFWYSAAMR